MLRIQPERHGPRRARMVGRNLWHLFKAIALATFVTALWYWWGRHYVARFPRIDREVLSMIIVIAIVPFAILAAEILKVSWRQLRVVVDCLWLQTEEDKRTFLKLRRERVMSVLHLLLGIYAVVLIVLVLLVDYSEDRVGAVSVFTTTTVFSLFWVVLAIVENPMKSEWVRNRVPPEWLTIDPETYFARLRLDARQGAATSQGRPHEMSH